MTTMSTMDKLPRGALDRRALAKRLGIAPDSVTRYVSRGDAPHADGHLDNRVAWWSKKTVDEWIANRPGRGGHAARRRREAAGERTSEAAGLLAGPGARRRGSVETSEGPAHQQ